MKWRVLTCPARSLVWEGAHTLNGRRNPGLLEQTHLQAEERLSPPTRFPKARSRSKGECDVLRSCQLTFSLPGKAHSLPPGTPPADSTRHRISRSGKRRSTLLGPPKSARRGGEAGEPEHLTPYLRRRNLKRARDLGVELLDAGEALHSARGAPVRQLRVEDQPACGSPGR